MSEAKTMEPKDTGGWAHPVDRLATTATGAPDDAVTGRRVAGPVQGFGQMWQKTFRVRLDGIQSSRAVMAMWKDEFPRFWPKSAKFYAPLAGIAPGEVALLDMAPIPGSPVRFSTGVMVIYADDESFTFMSPEGHILSAWITFSAFEDGDTTVAQVQALERPSDPIDELGYMLGGNRLNSRFWEETLRAPGAARRDDRSHRRDHCRVRRSAPPVAVRSQPAPQRHDPLDDADGDRPGSLGGGRGPRPKLIPRTRGRR